MVRVLLACVLIAFAAGVTTPASAGVKIVRAADHTPSRYVKHRHRHPRVVALAVPRCYVRRRTAVYGLDCPRIAWAGSAPRQPWSYEVFRTKARWEQKSALWQSYIRPGRSNPTIYWGY